MQSGKFCHHDPAISLSGSVNRAITIATPIGSSDTDLNVFEHDPIADLTVTFVYLLGPVRTGSTSHAALWWLEDFRS